MDVLIIRDNIAIDCISADSVERAQSLLAAIFPGATFIERPAGVGTGMALEGGVWVERNNAASVRVIPTVDFRSRFADAEMDAIMSLAYSGTGDVTARRILLKLQTRSDIDLDDQRVIDGMAYWVSKGIMTQERANAILS